MTLPIKVTIQDLSQGIEIIRVYDSKQIAMIETNKFVIKLMAKYSVEELFVRYESYKEKKIDSLDLPF